MSKTTKSLVVTFRELYLSFWPLCYSKIFLRPLLPIVVFLPDVAKNLTRSFALLFFPETLACTQHSIDADPNPCFVRGLEWRSAKHFWLTITYVQFQNPKSSQNQKLFLLLIQLVEHLTWKKVRLFVVFISFCRNGYMLAMKCFHRPR